MRKILALFLSLIFVGPSIAGIHIAPDIVEETMKQYIGPEKIVDAMNEYLSQVKAANGSGIEADKLWNVCKAAGWAVDKPAGKEKCQQFVKEMVDSATVKYFQVCGDDKGKSGGTEYCVNFYQRINVRPAIGVQLAKEYAHIKHKDDSVQCFGDYRTKSNDDIIKCTSKNKNAFYEFVFDDLNESVDDKIHNDTVLAVCGLYGAQASFGGKYVSEDGKSLKNATATCAVTGAQQCANINTSMQKFGYNSKYISNKCIIDINSVYSPSKLRNDFKDRGINSFVFCSEDIQISNDMTLEEALSQYLASRLGVNRSSVNCLAGSRTYTGGGCRVGNMNLKDDIKTCNIGNKYIDFVFDDVNELSKTSQRGGMSGIMCINADGVFDGANCVALGQEQCNALRVQMSVHYPDAKAIYWDDKAKLCVMPDAKTAQLTREISEYAVKTGVAVTVVAVAAASGGTALAVVGTVAAASGLAVEAVSEGVMKWGIYEPWLENKINECLISGDSKCAEEIVRRDIQKMISYAKDFTPQQQAALDETFYRLIDNIPEDSDFWLDFFGDPDFWECDTNGENCTVKTEEQFWQVSKFVGQGLQIAGGLMQLVGGVKGMVKSMQQIHAKVVANMNNKSALLKHLNPNGTTGALVSNDLTRAWYGGLTNSQLVKNQGWKVGQTVMLNNLGKQGIVVFAKPGGIAAVAEITRAAGDGLYDALNNSKPLIVSRKRSGDNNVETPHTIPDDKADDEKAETPQPVVAPVAPLKPDVPKQNAPVEPVVPVPVTPTPLPDTPVAPVDTPNTFGSLSIVKTETVNNSTVVNNSRRTDMDTKQSGRRRNTGAIVAAAVGGTVAAGLLVGGIVVATNNKSSSAPVANVPQTDTVLESLMNIAMGSLGTVDGRTLTLVPLPTTVNSNAPIVMIDGRVVVVVLYNGYKLPFYLAGQTWEPLMGIGSVGHWFNVYPNSPLSGIAKIDAITNLLNQQLSPSLVMRYANANNVYGVTFPMADQSAFNIINSEFPNGVVQTGNFTDADRTLYNNNYQMMQKKMN